MKDLDMAKKLIEEDKKARGHKCIEKINEVLQQLNCDLVINYSIVNNEPKGQIQVIALDEQPQMRTVNPDPGRPSKPIK
jgi:hypothetical protein